MKYRQGNGDRLPISVPEAEDLVGKLGDCECAMPGGGVFDQSTVAYGSVRNLAYMTRRLQMLHAISDPDLATAYSYVEDYYNRVAPRAVSSGEILAE